MYYRLIWNNVCWVKGYSLQKSQVAHQAGAYPDFCSTKRLRVFLLPPGWDASPSKGYPLALRSPVPIYTPGWRETLLRVKWLAQEHNTMSSARAWTRTARSGVSRTNHKATAPVKYPSQKNHSGLKFYFTAGSYFQYLSWYSTSLPPHHGAGLFKTRSRYSVISENFHCSLVTFRWRFSVYIFRPLVLSLSDNPNPNP